MLTKIFFNFLVSTDDGINFRKASAYIILIIEFYILPYTYVITRQHLKATLNKLNSFNSKTQFTYKVEIKRSLPLLSECLVEKDENQKL